jgi:segregation and condensation protein B
MPRLKVVTPVSVDESEPAPEAQEGAQPQGQFEARPEELRLLEAMLFASADPLDEKSLAARLPQGVDVPAALARLQEEYATRGVNLCASTANGPSALRMISWLLSRRPSRRALLRAAIETLAIIAYHQPVTRAEIEEIRGVTTSRARSTCCWRPDDPPARARKAPGGR